MAFCVHVPDCLEKSILTTTLEAGLDTGASASLITRNGQAKLCVSFGVETTAMCAHAKPSKVTSCFKHEPRIELIE